MITLTSNNPSDIFSKTTHEFHKDKLVVKQNSLLRDFEREIAYSKIAKLSCAYSASGYQIWYSILASSIVGFVFTFTQIDNSYPIIEKIGQIFFVLGIVFALLGFRKKIHWQLLDKDNRRLTTIDIDLGQTDDFDEAIKLIQEKSKETAVLDPLDPNPSAKPRFAIIDRNIPDFFSTSNPRFYDDKVLDYHNGLDNDTLTEVRYRDLGENITWARSSNPKWMFAFLYAASLSFLITTTRPVFNLYPAPIIPRISIAILYVAIFFALFLFKKDDWVIFCNKQNEQVYGIRASKVNRQTIEQAVEFVQRKVAGQTRIAQRGPETKRKTRASKKQK